MNWENRPEFEDSLEKRKVKVHNTFGGKVVEILYGAKDADGNPTEPKDAAVDGHGRWYGIEVDGKYCMFAWRKPASEGGETVYGTEYKEDGLDIMETEVRKKLDLCRDAENAARTLDGDEAKEKLAAIKAEWDAMTDWQTPKEAEYAERLSRTMERYDEIEKARAEASEAKQAIINQAEELKDSTNWRETGNKLRDLRKALSDIEGAGNAADRAFRKKFREIEDEFHARRTEYFATIDERRAESKKKKEELIEEAKGLLTKVTNWKAVGDKMDDLFTQWRAAGSSGREYDDALWEEFKQLRTQFFDGRRNFFEERNAQWNASKEKKRALIEEAKQITATEDYGRDNTDRMKELDKEWKTAGFSGKADNDRLWDEFTEAKEAFWDAKRGEINKRSEAALERKEAEAAQLKKEIEDLEFKITITTKVDAKYELENSVDRKKDRLDAVEADIANIKERLSKQ